MNLNPVSKIQPQPDNLAGTFTGKQILLVDSSAAMHRYHHSPTAPLISNYGGREVNVTALHGYLRYVLKLSRDFNFDHLIHVLDPPGGSLYRKQLYPEYKAGRPETPAEFVLQKKLLTKVLDAFAQGWAEVPDVEADDVIASVATQFAAQGAIVTIVTPDKDLLQLVENGKIHVARPEKDANGWRVHNLMDEQGVFNKLGVWPYQVADYLALMDDIVDNIHGVHKCGAKTAAKWLAKYGDLESVITNQHDIKGSIAQHLQEATAHLPLNKKLTTVLRDIPVDLVNLTTTRISQPQLLQQARTLVVARPDWPDNLLAERGPNERMDFRY